MSPTGPLPELQLKTRDQALVILGTLFEKNELEAMLQYLPEDRREELTPWAAILRDMPGKDRVKFALGRLKTFLDPAYLEKIDEIHPSWIARFLEKEPPALAGMVLKSLPARYVSRVLSIMDEERVHDIRRIFKQLNPNPRVRELLLLILVRQFNLINRLSGIGKDPFEMLFFLNGSELMILIEELGVAELAMACQNLPEKDFAYISKKLPDKMQEKIQLKLEQYRDIEPERIRRARRCFLHMKDEKYYEKGQLIHFTALHILAQALYDISEQRINFLKYKLPVKTGLLLEHLIRGRKVTPPSEEIGESRREIMEKIVYLSEIDRIRSLWKHYWRG
ncbi:MAG: hypothetical protein JXQ27_12900 [Acidobacteria bacterium]|nr:hypothetical protein [Acidobacteriota bacterium]